MVPRELRVVEAGQRLRLADLAEVWSYRDLVRELVLRELRVRYKQTLLGGAWAALQPLATTAVFAVLFGVLMGPENSPSVAGAPYAVSTLCALAPWTLFASVVVDGSGALVNNRALITKVYFPRSALLLAPCGVALLDLAVSLCSLFVVTLAYAALTDFHWHLGLRVFAIVPLSLLAVIAALSVTVWLSAINALYRDVRHTVPFLIRLGTFITPTVYPAQRVLDHVSPSLGLLYMANPMAGVVEGFRWALLGSPPPDVRRDAHQLCLHDHPSGFRAGVLPPRRSPHRR